ncbi:Lrp/AsnC family transcriptional regulator, partial [Salmonella enterica subsp. diarizonae]|nr:Lrp/AsnC family transcriptional regulator [Salmonella enterica subsp. diarizonae]
MAFLTQLLPIINIRLSFCAQISEKHGKNCCY